MHDDAGPLPGTLLSVEDDLAREFEVRLVESSTLAFRVAFGVLRQRQDAEDIAQEAFARAHRHFRQLRDREPVSRVAGADDLAAGDQPPAR